MKDASAAAQEHAGSHDTQAAPSLGQRASTCARLIARMVIARFHGDHAEALRLESEVRFASRDPLWLESVLEYERSLLLHRAPFYRRHESLDDFVLAELPEEATVAVLADWGTGMPDARALLEQISTFSPHAILHLGDIYYSGTPHEVRAHFLDVFTRVFGSKWPRVLSLSGNHDRYSGGEGYRVLLEALGQPASYFCLRNRSWQLLGMDTGLHDFNPRALADTLTWLEDTEAVWLVDKLHRAGGRGTVLLSHHPYFSLASVGHDAERRPLAVNPRLQGSLGSIVGEVALWLWGHEHNVHLYEPYAGLARGRCIGGRGAHPAQRAVEPSPPGAGAGARRIGAAPDYSRHAARQRRPAGPSRLRHPLPRGPPAHGALLPDGEPAARPRPRAPTRAAPLPGDRLPPALALPPSSGAIRPPGMEVSLVVPVGHTQVRGGATRFLARSVMPIPDSPIDITPGPSGLNKRNTSGFWGGPFVMGLLITLLGVVALAAVPITSLATVIFYGSLLVVGGVFEMVHAFRVRKTGPFLMFLLGGVLSIVVGALLLMRPGIGLVSLTLLMAGFFFARGLFRGITSLMDRYSGWGWDCAYGIVSVALGAIIFAQLPYSSMWALGVVVGVEILSRGVAMMAAALAFRGALRRLHA